MNDFQEMWDDVMDSIGEPVSITIDGKSYAVNSVISSITSFEVDERSGREVKFSKLFSLTLPSGVRLPRREDTITHCGIVWTVSHIQNGLGDNSRIGVTAERAQGITIGSNAIKGK